MQEKRIQEVMGNVQKYLVHSGISHHFKEQGIFSHINLEAEIHRVIVQSTVDQLASEYPKSPKINAAECIEVLCSEDYESIAEKAFLDFFKLINFVGISQALIIDKVRKYQQLIGTAEEDLLGAEGQCGGIVLAYIAGEINKGTPHTPAQLQDFEQCLSRIAQWDGESAVDGALKNDMEFFIKRVGALQAEQSNPFPVFNDMLGSNPILSNLSLAWVHNQHTLDFIFKEVYKTQPQLIYLGADYHASMIQPLSENEILYFNPNQQFGSMRLKVDHTFYSLFCGGLSTGHSNTYVERMPLALTCYSSQNCAMDLEKILDTLVNITIEHDLDSRLRSMGPVEASRIIVNRQASNGRTALMEAAIRGNIDEVRLLLNKYGADPRLMDIHHNDALRYAIRYGHENVALEILNHKVMTGVNKVSDGMTYLHLALLHGQREVVNKLLSSDDIQLNTKSKDKRFLGFTSLHFAIVKGFDDTCERLINNDDVVLNTAEGARGMTPLHMAIDLHKPNVVKLLLKQKRVNVDKCSTEVDEEHPQGFSAFVYLAKEFSYLDSDEADYSETLSVLVDIYEQLMKVNASQDGLTSEDRLYLWEHLVNYDERYANNLLQDFRQGLIRLENNERCLNWVEYLISNNVLELNESDFKLLEFYLSYSLDIDLEAIVRHLDTTPELTSRLSETNKQKLINLTSVTHAEELDQVQPQPEKQVVQEETHRYSGLVRQSFFKEAPKKTSTYSNVALVVVLGLAGVGTILSQYPVILNAFLGQPNLEDERQNQFCKMPGC